MPTIHGTYPFGSPLVKVEQRDRSPKRVFVLGVYASAVHARWLDPGGRQLVRALAVASEPTIFWTGSHAASLIAAIEVPAAAGRLEPADARLNGPSGRSLDEDYLVPLGLSRADTWLCDLVPHTCINPSQLRAIERAYEPRRAALGLPNVDLPAVPKTFADAGRRRELVEELEASAASTLVLLGDQPIRHFLAHFDRRWSKLSDFADTDDGYGARWPVKIEGRAYDVLPLAHPRQVRGLGAHSDRWRTRHRAWLGRAAS
jgi:hypothetical protein